MGRHTCTPPLSHCGCCRCRSCRVAWADLPRRYAVRQRSSLTECTFVFRLLPRLFFASRVMLVCQAVIFCPVPVLITIWIGYLSRRWCCDGCCSRAAWCCRAPPAQGTCERIWTCLALSWASRISHAFPQWPRTDGSDTAGVSFIHATDTICYRVFYNNLDFSLQAGTYVTIGCCIIAAHVPDRTSAPSQW